MRSGTALIIIDMIEDFVTGKFKNDRAQRIVPNIREVITVARDIEMPVIYVSDFHSEDDHELSIWGEHAIEGDSGSDIIPELSPESGDYTLKKDKYSAFYNTELEDLLKDLEVDTVVLTGVLTHICIQHTAADAFFRGYDIVIPDGCVEDLSESKNKMALEFIKENYGAEIIDYEDLVGMWE